MCSLIKFGVMRVGKHFMGSDSFMHALYRGTVMHALYRDLADKEEPPPSTQPFCDSVVNQFDY